LGALAGPLQKIAHSSPLHVGNKSVVLRRGGLRCGGCGTPLAPILRRCAQPPSASQQGPHRLVVRTSRCGRDNPGSTPGVDIFLALVPIQRFVVGDAAAKLPNLLLTLRPRFVLVLLLCPALPALPRFVPPSLLRFLLAWLLRPFLSFVAAAKTGARRCPRPLTTSSRLLGLVA
jgi:hypothetical protein